MRLINTTTLELENFPDNATPPYAILSHTWADDAKELTYQGVRDGNANYLDIGWQKLAGCCKLAKQNNISYAWIDTCCIDKTNSVELGEAINSMFRWYRAAAICYVYLPDVPTDDIPRQDGSRFQSSRWFRRGWTLQELLAPKHVQFYNSEWGLLGTKGGLHAAISKIAGIPREFLLGIAELHTASVAQRMSWAAQRQTKREEDAAYCLLGIFNISMPMIYGEGGDHAFLRLQEQILKNTRDDSILAWGLNAKASQSNDTSSDQSRARRGRILAIAPSEFANSGHVVTKQSLSSLDETISLTGGGIRINLSVLERSTGETGETGEIIALLRCGLERDSKTVVGIPLIRFSSNEFARPDTWESVLVVPLETSNNARQSIYITNNTQREQQDGAETRYWLYDEEKFTQFNLDLVEVFPKSCWHRESSLFKVVCTSDEIDKHRIWVRFRHPNEDCLDFVILLWLEKVQPSSPIIDRCGVLVCSRKTDLKRSTSDLRDMPLTAFNSNCASNGSLVLRVKTVPEMRETVSIEPEKVDIEPQSGSTPFSRVTFHGTTDLAELYLQHSSTRSVEKSEKMYATQNTLHSSIVEKREMLQKLGVERHKLEIHIQRLQKRATALAETERNGSLELRMMKHEQTGLQSIQFQIEGSWSEAQVLRRQLLCYHSGQDACDLFKMIDEKQFVWAEKHNLLSPVKKLIQYGGDASHAPRNRHILVREVSTREEILSCAAANGHEDVIRLLLGAGNMSIDARNDSGFTPLEWAASKGNEAIVKVLLDASTRADKHVKLDMNDYECCVGFPQDSKLVVCRPCQVDYTFSLKSMRQASQMEKLMYHNNTIRIVVFSYDGTLLASAFADGRIGIWDVTTGKRKIMLDGEGKCPVSVAFSLGSKFVAVAHTESVRIWETTTGICTHKLRITGSLVAISSDAKFLASGPRNIVEIWNPSTLQRLHSLRLATPTTSKTCVGFSCDSKQIVCMTDHQDLMVWVTVTGQSIHSVPYLAFGEGLHKLRVMYQPLRSVVFSHDFERIVGISDLTVCQGKKCQDTRCRRSELLEIKREVEQGV